MLVGRERHHNYYSYYRPPGSITPRWSRPFSSSAVAFWLGLTDQLAMCLLPQVNCTWVAYNLPALSFIAHSAESPQLFKCPQFSSPYVVDVQRSPPSVDSGVGYHLTSLPPVKAKNNIISWVYAVVLLTSLASTMSCALSVGAAIVISYLCIRGRMEWLPGLLSWGSWGSDCDYYDDVMWWPLMKSSNRRETSTPQRRCW